MRQIAVARLRGRDTGCGCSQRVSDAPGRRLERQRMARLRRIRPVVRGFNRGFEDAARRRTALRRSTVRVRAQRDPLDTTCGSIRHYTTAVVHAATLPAATTRTLLRECGSWSRAPSAPCATMLGTTPCGAVLVRIGGPSEDDRSGAPAPHGAGEPRSSGWCDPGVLAVRRTGPPTGAPPAECRSGRGRVDGLQAARDLTIEDFTRRVQTQRPTQRRPPGRSPQPRSGTCRRERISVVRELLYGVARATSRASVPRYGCAVAHVRGRRGASGETERPDPPRSRQRDLHPVPHQVRRQHRIPGRDP